MRGRVGVGEEIRAPEGEPGERVRFVQLEEVDRDVAGAQAKDLGDVDIEACSLSMDLLHLEESDLDPLVDGVEGVTAFWLAASEGQVVFI